MRYLRTVLVVVGLLAVAFGVYSWQHTKEEADQDRLVNGVVSAAGLSPDPVDEDQTAALVAFGVGGVCLVGAMLAPKRKDAPAEAGDVTTF